MQDIVYNVQHGPYWDWKVAFDLFFGGAGVGAFVFGIGLYEFWGHRYRRIPHTAAYSDFIGRYPDLGKAWELIGQTGGDGPLDAKTARLVKLAIAIGAMREGAVHSSVRKAVAAGIDREAVEQVVALAAGTMGLPSTVAVFTWVREAIDR